jgi:hypothetical protein
VSRDEEVFQPESLSNRELWIEYTFWLTMGVPMVILALIGERGAAMHFAASRRAALKASVSKQKVCWSNYRTHAFC